eukprot:gnl/TRDRNA2_/TRDRNA2_161680_c0_seq2.p1 gnl/TRDRNA2_/TRDRNA2_161680_c0~~gnl/TRDRNA2_/TRDRNA2_161680_c0_seq2.p1  ORF type:complete len:380 (+),score=50.38 gnl/TRDRNA2_/TRDRNA2_161680_c0_seq2:32-1171(+)
MEDSFKSVLSSEEARAAAGCLYVHPHMTATREGVLDGFGLVLKDDVPERSVLLLETPVSRVPPYLHPCRPAEVPWFLYCLPIGAVPARCWVSSALRWLRVKLNCFPEGIIFAVGSAINHSCDPNVHRVSLANGLSGFVPLRSLTAGEELTLAYVELGNPRWLRRFNLFFFYGFWCRCPRCCKNGPAAESHWASIVEKLEDRWFKQPLECSFQLEYDSCWQVALRQQLREYGVDIGVRLDDKRLRTVDSNGAELTHPCQPDRSQFPLSIAYLAEEETVFERDAKRIVPGLKKRWAMLEQTMHCRVGTTWCLVSHQLLSLSPMFVLIGVLCYWVLTSPTMNELSEKNGPSVRWLGAICLLILLNVSEVKTVTSWLANMLFK